MRHPEPAFYLQHRAALQSALDRGDPRWSAEWLRQQIRAVDMVLGGVPVVRVEVRSERKLP